MKKLIQSLFYYFISAVGISLTIKANVGVSSFNSLNVSIANLSTLQIGTVTTLLNISFLIGCVLLDKERSFPKYLLMLLAVMSFGEVINLVYYHLFSQFTIDSYLLNLILFLLGVVIAGFGTGQVLRLSLLKFPIESFCQLLAEKTSHSFSTYRYSVDIVCVSLSLILSFAFSLPVVVREGTIISLFLLSGVINWSKELFTRKGLVEG
ncbi:YczE/YyaS/YitT family protein [Vagococcus carniphilus]|uniref:YczE/YyaS/YitT family protein n=1 Tax=Vagococcus carniphilus TaxID=218144 RepID=UPI003BABEE88